MRIIGGDYKRRLIRFPKTKKTRPVMDRVKETIFNVLGDAVDGAMVLDLFAGSGSFGLESLSRGTKAVYFVDRESTPCVVIRQNLEFLAIPRTRSRICKMTVEQAIRKLHMQRLRFNLIFIDPPFNKGLIKKTLRLLERFDIVEPLGKIVIQRSRHEELPGDLTAFKITQEKKIGQAFVDFLVFQKNRTERN